MPTTASSRGNAAVRTSTPAGCGRVRVATSRRCGTNCSGQRRKAARWRAGSSGSRTEELTDDDADAQHTDAERSATDGETDPDRGVVWWVARGRGVVRVDAVHQAG